MTIEALQYLLRELEILHAEEPEDDAAEEQLYNRHWALRERVDATPAKTIAELKLKARAAEMALERDPQADCAGAGAFVSLAQSINRDIDAIADAAGVSREA